MLTQCNLRCIGLNNIVFFFVSFLLLMRNVVSIWCEHEASYIDQQLVHSYFYIFVDHSSYKFIDVLWKSLVTVTSLSTTVIV